MYFRHIVLFLCSLARSLKINERKSEPLSLLKLGERKRLPPERELSAAPRYRDLLIETWENRGTKSTYLYNDGAIRNIGKK